MAQDTTQLAATIGQRIRRLRLERDMTQKELADLIPIRERYISDWERGMLLPNVKRLGPLCNALGVSVDYLISG